jgi:hypothetical protein
MEKTATEDREEIINRHPVRTPPRRLREYAPRSPEYLRACRKYTLVLETDGYGVIPHRQ